MDLERKMNQTMTVYRKSGQNNKSGAPIVGAPFTVICRWSQTNEKFVVNNGDEVYVKAWISTTQELEQGDLVALGDTTAFSDPGDTDAQELKRDSAIPNLSADSTLFIYFV